jgi:predicted Zn-dependent peptidase
MVAVIRFDRLSCGMPVCIQTSDESKLFGISVWINGGSAQDPVGKGGLAHLCEHLLLRPLACNNSWAYTIQLETGALVNAFTDSEWVVISAQAPVEQFKFLIDLLSALVRNPYSEPNGMEAEKKVILQELSDEELSPAELLARVFRESAFADNPCVRPVGGTPATLGALKISDAQEYYTRYLNTSKILITAHGGNSALYLTAMLNKAFKDFPETSTPSDSPINESAIAAQFLPDYRPVRIHKDMSNRGSHSNYGMLVGFGSVPRRTEKYWAALAFEVLMADGPSSLLSQWMRNERPQIYGAVSMTEAFSNWGSQYFLIRISHDQAEEVVEYLGQQWRALPKFVTDKRVGALNNQLASRALSSLARLQDRMTMMRDTVLAETRKSGTLEGGLEAIVARHVRELNSANLLSYIRQYAEWDRVSLVCAPI